MRTQTAFQRINVQKELLQDLFLFLLDTCLQSIYSLLARTVQRNMYHYHLSKYICKVKQSKMMREINENVIQVYKMQIHHIFEE